MRQLATGRYRQVVRSLERRAALVVGNPSVDRFDEYFRSSSGGELKTPPALVHAEEEAEAVAAVLGSLGYAVEAVIGDDRTANDVLAALFREPWRIVHISAHGVFDQMHVDGKPRSGVVLSDGLLITAAEIAAMESVPELVFLNCCHLAKVDFVSHDGNRLAASLSRELIEAACAASSWPAGRSTTSWRCVSAEVVLCIPAQAWPDLRRCRLRSPTGGLERVARRHHLGRLPGLWRPRLARREAR